MNTRWTLRMALVLAVAISCTPWAVFAADSVVVASRTVPVGTPQVDIPIRFVNDTIARAVVIPLEIRPLTGGCMPTAVALQYDERLRDDFLTEIQIVSHYAVKDGICGSSGAPTYWTSIEDSVGAAVEITGEAWGILFGALGWPSSHYLPPGADSVGSFVLTLWLPNQSGSFIIDSTCIAPNNHLYYLDESTHPHVSYFPAFTPGIVSVVGCDCALHGDLDGNDLIDAVDVSLLIDWVYFFIGPPPVDGSCPHIDRGDVDCNGVDDGVDVSYLVDYVNFGGDPPCDPCDCSPYPASCP